MHPSDPNSRAAQTAPFLFEISKLQGIGIAILLLLQILLIWWFPYFPSQDGPAHLATVSYLISLSHGDDFFSQIYQSAWQFKSNQIYHGLLYLLGQIMPLLYAEKLILSVYGIGLLVALLYVIRCVRGRIEMIFLGFPVVFTHIFYLGFFNSCIALIAALWSLGLYFKISDRDNWRIAVYLSIALLLTYFLHVFVVIIVLLAMGLMSLARLAVRIVINQNDTIVSNQRLFFSELGISWKLLVAATPTLLALIHFLFSTNQTSNSSSSLLAGSKQVASFDGFDLISKAESILFTFSYLDLLIQLPWMLLLFWITIFAIKSKKASGSNIGNVAHASYMYLWIGPLVLLLLIIILPRQSGPIVWTHSRLSPFFTLSLIVWLSTCNLSTTQWRRIAIIGFVVSATQLIYRFPAHSELNKDIIEFVSAGSVLQNETSFLPIVLREEAHGFLALGGQKLQYSPLFHAGGYLVLDRPLLYAGNYQMGFPYFPIEYSADIFLDILSKKWKADKFIYDLGSSDLGGLPNMNTVLVWGDSSLPANRGRFKSLSEQLEFHGFQKQALDSYRSYLAIYQR